MMVDTSGTSARLRDWIARALELIDEYSSVDDEDLHAEVAELAEDMLEPEDLFQYNDLARWARAHGFKELRNM